MTRSDIGDAVSDAVARTVAIAGLGGIALIHILEAPDAFDGTFYLGILFIIAIVAAVVLAAALTSMSDDRVWMAAAGLPALILILYIISRSIGLPDFTGDIGEWTEPLGLASMVVEGLTFCVAAAALAARRRTAVAGVMITVETSRRTVPPAGAAPAA
jgi:hypothetical protein